MQYGKIRLWCSLILATCLLIFSAGVLEAEDQTLTRWEKTKTIEDPKYTGHVDITVTWYSAEYVKAKVQNEAEKNLWTKSEMEDYQYRLLKNLRFSETIPVEVTIDNMGPSMHMAPFEEQIYLWAGGKKYSPVDYDKRLNFKVTDKISGFVYFPRFDGKGEPILKGVSSIKISLKGGITSLYAMPYIDYYFDVGTVDIEEMFEGTAAARLEIDRLIKRLEKLNEEKTKLEEELAEINAEIRKVQSRLDELQ